FLLCRCSTFKCVFHLLKRGVFRGETAGGSTGTKTARIVLYSSPRMERENLRQSGEFWRGNMRRLLFALFGTAAGAAALVFASAAIAATPTQIYRDYADNGRLDGHYSRSDLDRALKDAVLQGYGNANVQP